MWFKKKKQPKKINYTITKKTLRLDDPYIIYQISNITNVSKKIRIPGFYITKLGIFILLLLGSFLVYINHFSLNFWSFIGVFLIATGLKEIYNRINRKILYGFCLETNDGNSFTIFIEQENFVEKAIEQIYDVMESKEDSIVNHYNGTFYSVDQSNSNIGTGLNFGNIANAIGFLQK